MINKKIPMRICLVSNEKLPKKELLRIVHTNDGKIVIDETGKVNGHGAYIKRNIEIVEKLKKSKKLDKLFNTNINDEFYQELINILK